MTKPIRVMQSFREPRGTTNPYITMLDDALASEARVTHLRFSWMRALLGRYDVFHWHWPEAKLHGSRRILSVGKCILTGAVVGRHAVSRHVAVVRTLHNVELPDDSPWRLRLLRQIDRGTDLAIVLNDVTTPPVTFREGLPLVRIAHGHYRDWYQRLPSSSRIPGRIGTFGGIRRYKSLDMLISAFRDAVSRESSMSLSIGGRPSTAELGAAIARQIADLPGVRLQAEFLDDAELVTLATTSELVVLAYRFMHNSGSVLAALSLDRPVLVPRNEVNDALAEEVGERWVLRFDGDLDGQSLVAAWRRAHEIGPGERPDLSAREWTGVGAAHADAYERAIAERRRPRASSVVRASGRERTKVST